MLKIKLEDKGIAPRKAHKGDAGWDLFTPFEVTLEPGNRATIDMRFRIQGEVNTYYRIDDKSGLASKGLAITGGVIDRNYTGTVHVIIQNLSDVVHTFKAGDKIAQLLVCPVEEDSDLEFVSEIEGTTRGEGGLGSTGLK